MRVKDSLGFFLSRRRTTLNGESLKEWIEIASSKASDSFIVFWDIKRRMPRLLKENESTHHIFIIEYIVMDKFQVHCCKSLFSIREGCIMGMYLS